MPMAQGSKHAASTRVNAGAGAVHARMRVRVFPRQMAQWCAASAAALVEGRAACACVAELACTWAS